MNSRIRVKFGAEIFHFYTNFCLKINSFCQPELFHIFIPQSRQNFFKKSPINLRIKKIWAYLCVKDFYTAIILIFHSPIFIAPACSRVRYRRPIFRQSVRPSVRLSTFMSTFDIYVKLSILINYKTKQPSNLA